MRDVGHGPSVKHRMCLVLGGVQLHSVCAPESGWPVKTPLLGLTYVCNFCRHVDPGMCRCPVVWQDILQDNMLCFVFSFLNLQSLCPNKVCIVAIAQWKYFRWISLCAPLSPVVSIIKCSFFSESVGVPFPFPWPFQHLSTWEPPGYLNNITRYLHAPRRTF